MTEPLHIPRSGRVFERALNFTREKIRVDPLLTFLLVVVVAFGLVVLYSSLGKDDSALTGLLVKYLIGFGAMAVAASLTPMFYFRLTPLVYTAVIGLLVVVLVIGESAKGSQSWLDLPGLPRFQPSELLKVSIPLMIGWYLCLRRFQLKTLDLLAICFIAGLPIFLVFLQPDYGTAMVLVLGTLGILFCVGLKWRWVFALLGLVVIAAPIIWNFVFYDYHRTRILTLFNPDLDPQGAGWNIIQSRTAIGSGGMTGKGLFEGTQSQLDFLPEAHTDFILAVVGEELGFVCCVLLLLCYSLISIRSLNLSIRSSNGFGQVVGAGIAIIFFLYVVVNFAMVLGLLPVIGVPLPLVSWGGSSAITVLGSFGVIMALSTQKQWMDKE